MLWKDRKRKLEGKRELVVQVELRTVINEKKKRFRNWNKERTPQNEEAFRRAKQLAIRKLQSQSHKQQRHFMRT